MKKVLIIGVRAKLIHQLTNQFKGKLILKFLTDQHTNYCKKSKGEHDTVISCTGFVGHEVEDMYKRHPGYIRINGSKTAIIQTLNQLVIQ